MYHSGDQDNLEGYGDDDLWIAKINPEGEIVWDQLFGGSRDDIVSGGVFETEDGGIVVIASSRSPVSGNKQSPNFGDYDAWVVRLDSNGNKIWDRSYGTAGEQIPTAAAQFPNGDLLLASVSIRGSDRGLLYGNRDLWVLRLDQTGRKLWSRTLGGHGDDYAGSVIPWHDREAIISGYSYSPVIRRGTPAGYNLWLLRLGQHGATLWDLPIGTSDREVGGRAFMEATDGEFYLGGFSSKTIRGGNPGSVIFKVGPSQICDRDNDGVADERDRCPATPKDEAVDEHGCSVTQLVPYDRRWRDNCQYLATLQRLTSEFVSAKRLTRGQKATIIANAISKHHIRGCPQLLPPAQNDTYNPSQ